MGLDPTHREAPEPPVRVMRGYLIWPPELPDHVAHWLGHKTVPGGDAARGSAVSPSGPNEQGGRR